MMDVGHGELFLRYFSINSKIKKNNCIIFANINSILYKDLRFKTFKCNISEPISKSRSIGNVKLDQMQYPVDLSLLKYSNSLHYTLNFGISA
jgi:hypothetical protein